MKNERTRSALKFTMQNHAGSTIESIIRRQGHNISKLARHMKISRCTLYNWFEQDTLPFDVLIRIGSYINYDFSSDFPEIFSLNPNIKIEKQTTQNQFTENEKIDYWIKKYIVLLEKYNEILLNKNYI
jgi:predicted transcriptional regulator